MTLCQQSRHAELVPTSADAVKAASDYFNSLPFEERQKLAPLLEAYRRMGLREAHDAFKAAARKVADRMRPS